MDAGDLLPDELTTKMLIDEVNKHQIQTGFYLMVIKNFPS
jgi:adenylate kinase